MKITIITIVYNDVAHIEATIRNVVRQTAFNQIEYIVVDGASNDGTSDIIKQYLDKISKYICEPDTGIYNAMNKGLRIATGDYVVFINSGDKLSSESVIEEVINKIGESLPDIVYGSYREIREDGSTSAIIPCRNSDKIWYGPVASHQSTFYRLEHLRKNKISYDESFRIAADYKLTARAISMAKSTLKTDICISDFDISGISSMNQNVGLKEANQVRREIFGWGNIRIFTLSLVLLCSRYTKRYCTPIYKLIRHI